MENEDFMNAEKNKNVIGSPLHGPYEKICLLLSVSRLAFKINGFVSFCHRQGRECMSGVPGSRGEHGRRV